MTSGIRADGWEDDEGKGSKLEQLLGEWNCEQGIVTAWTSEAMNELRV